MASPYYQQLKQIQYQNEAGAAEALANIPINAYKGAMTGIELKQNMDKSAMEQLMKKQEMESKARVERYTNFKGLFEVQNNVLKKVASKDPKLAEEIWENTLKKDQNTIDAAKAIGLNIDDVKWAYLPNGKAQIDGVEIPFTSDTAKMLGIPYDPNTKRVKISVDEDGVTKYSGGVGKTVEEEMAVANAGKATTFNLKLDEKAFDELNNLTEVFNRRPIVANIKSGLSNINTAVESLRSGEAQGDALAIRSLAQLGGRDQLSVKELQSIVPSRKWTDELARDWNKKIEEGGLLTPKERIQFTKYAEKIKNQKTALLNRELTSFKKDKYPSFKRIGVTNKQVDESLIGTTEQFKMPQKQATNQTGMAVEGQTQTVRNKRTGQTKQQKFSNGQWVDI